MSTTKIPARVIHTSIRVPVTAEEYEAICRAAAARGAHSKAAWLRERGASFGLADGLEALAVREEALDALRRLLETREALDAAACTLDGARYRLTESSGSAIENARRSYLAAQDAYWAARAVAKEVAK